ASFELLLERRDELERFERRQAIDVDRTKQFEHRIGERVGRTAHEEIELRAAGFGSRAHRRVCAARELGSFFERAEKDARAREDGLGKSGELRARDAVASRRRAVLELVEEDDVALVLARRDAPVLAVQVRLRELG